ncbi:MAG: hypothetical protein JO093_17390 [Acidobacteria bacterium]|nr:hypothetical protein [Acidobacteriota bacterium]MBV9068963.1 hypothetical protein [Acidobacteriota bacterium]MBV9187394.1 hypothetical protein [Acidobacteriota bacterium]
MLALLFLLITTFQPPKPAIGDPITITFAAPTTVDPSADYEVISRNGNSVVIRTFVPHTITVNAHSAEGPVSVMIPIHSVLKPDDKLEPAPLKPPKPEPWPRLPFVAIGIAALAAIAAWIAVVILAKWRVTRPVIVVAPADEFRRRLRTLRPDAPKRWATLADIVRAYLAAVRTDLGAELTTSELLARIDEETERRRPAGWTAAGSAATSEIAGEPPALQPPSRRRYDGDASLVATILRQGDLEKFSPWGAAPADFDAIASQALAIPAWAEPPVVQAEEAA